MACDCPGVLSGQTERAFVKPFMPVDTKFSRRGNDLNLFQVEIFRTRSPGAQFGGLGEVV